MPESGAGPVCDHSGGIDECVPVRQLYKSVSFLILDHVRGEASLRSPLWNRFLSARRRLNHETLTSQSIASRRRLLSSPSLPSLPLFRLSRATHAHRG